MNKFLTSKITRNRLDKFIAIHSSDKSTLDLGCANSPYSHYFKNRVGLDIKPGKGVDVVADAHKLPFEDGKFNVILCTEVLEHLHSPEIAISEMRRVLKSGGELILTTRFIFPLHDTPDDYFRYTKYGLKHLFRDWEVVSLNEEADTKDTLAIFLQRVGLQSNFVGGFVVKVVVFLLAKFVSFMPSLIKEEFGNIGKTVKERNIFTSGYYLIAKKHESLA